MTITNKMMLACLVLASCSCSSSDTDYSSLPVERIIYVPVKDTISDKENIARIVNLEHQLTLTRDSLNAVRDTIGEDLFVARYKLARVKYYNDIAAKGNNIKYLRGWINRTLKE